MKILNDIQQKLKVPKNQYNSFGKYKYRSGEDILEAVKPLLKNDATLIINDEIVLIGDRYYVKATITLTSEKENISVSAYAREEENKKGMDASQITGSASSYARKYALNGLFGIDDTKDSDFTNKHETRSQEAKTPKQVSKPTSGQEKATEGKTMSKLGQQKQIHILCDKLSIKCEQFIFPAKSTKELGYKEANEMIKDLSKQVQEKENK